MNKKFLSAILFGALLITSTGTFVSCKDYDEDINNLQEQSNDLKAKVATLEAQASTLQTTLVAAQAALEKAQADATKAIADAAKAQGTADQAVKDAKAAKEAGEAAAAQAKVDAIKEAQTLVNNLKKELQTALDGKVDYSEYAAKVAEIEGKIVAIGEEIDVINGKLIKVGEKFVEVDGKIVTITNDIVTINENIATMQGVDADLQEQINALVAFVGYFKDYEGQNLLARIMANEANIGINAAAIAANKEAILANASAIAVNKEAIAANASQIARNIEAIADLYIQLAVLENETKASIEQAKDELYAYIKNEITRVEELIQKTNDDVKALGEEVQRVDNLLFAGIDALNVLITKRLTSIELLPKIYVDGIEAVEFTSLIFAPIPEVGQVEKSNWAPITERSKSAAKAEATVIGSTCDTPVEYTFNPANFKLDDAEYTFVDNNAVVRRSIAEAQKSELVEIVKDPVKVAAEGAAANAVQFFVKRINANKTQAAKGEANFVALEATMKEAAKTTEDEVVPVVTSPYYMVKDNYIYQGDFRIGDKVKIEEGCRRAEDAHYYQNPADAIENGIYYEMKYNEGFDLKALVATCYEHKIFDEQFDCYGLSYRFYVPKIDNVSEVAQTVTDQQKDITCPDAKAGVFYAKDPETGYNREFIGRTPVFQVDLVDAEENVVARGFVKVRIVANKTAVEPVVVPGETFVYNCGQDFTITYTVDKMREDILRRVSDGDNQGISHEEFWAIYEPAQDKVWDKTSTAYVYVKNGVSTIGTETKEVEMVVVGSNIQKITATTGNTYAIEYKLVNKDVKKFGYAANGYPAEIVFKFAATVVQPTWAWQADSTTGYWKDGVVQANVAVPANVNSPASECQFNVPWANIYRSFTFGFANKMKCYSVKLVVNNVLNDTKGNLFKGVKVENEYFTATSAPVIKLAKDNAAIKTALNSTQGLQAVFDVVVEMNTNPVTSIVVNTFAVNFIRPVNVNVGGYYEVKDAVTGGDEVIVPYTGLLTDWRGEYIVNPFWTWKEAPEYSWVLDCEVEDAPVLIPGWQEIIKQAEPVIEKTPIYSYYPAAWTGYVASIEYIIEKNVKDTPKPGFDKDNWTPAGISGTVTSGPAPTQEAALANLEVAFAEKMATEVPGNTDAVHYRSKPELNKEGHFGPAEKATVTYDDFGGEAGEYVYYIYQIVDWKPAVIRTHDPVIVWVEHDHNRRPHGRGNMAGERNGCWVWQQVGSHPTVAWETGQYWDFYGEFAPAVFSKVDMDHLTTDLNPLGTLPTGAEFTFAGVDWPNGGFKFIYKNTNTTLQNDFAITIPVKVAYGWGELSDNIVINVVADKK